MPWNSVRGWDWGENSTSWVWPCDGSLRCLNIMDRKGRLDSWLPTLHLVEHGPYQVIKHPKNWWCGGSSIESRRGLGWDCSLRSVEHQKHWPALAVRQREPRATCIVRPTKGGVNLSVGFHPSFRFMIFRWWTLNSFNQRWCKSNISLVKSPFWYLKSKISMVKPASSWLFGGLNQYLKTSEVFRIRHFRNFRWERCLGAPSPSCRSGLRFVDERRQRLIWVTSDGRRSIWSKPGTVVERRGLAGGGWQFQWVPSFTSKNHSKQEIKRFEMMVKPWYVFCWWKDVIRWE